MDQYELTVEGMSCAGCEETLTSALQRVDGVHRVDADHEAGTVAVAAADGTENAVREAIHEAGYDVPA